MSPSTVRPTLVLCDSAPLANRPNPLDGLRAQDTYFSRNGITVRAIGSTWVIGTLRQRVIWK